jgi:hypothetical protein
VFLNERIKLIEWNVVVELRAMERGENVVNKHIK